MKPKRLDYLDCVKAFAIITVVAGHVLMYDLYGNNAVWGESKLMAFIYSFHMPLFIFCSGLVSITNIQPRELIHDIKKRFRSLIVPALLIGTMYTLLFQGSLIVFFTSEMKNGYWYLFVLFELYLINYPLALLKNCKIWHYILLFLSWIFVFRHSYIIPKFYLDLFCLNLTLTYYPYYLLGNIVKRYSLHKYLFSKFGLAIGLLLWLIAILYTDPFTHHFNISTNISTGIYKSISQIMLLISEYILMFGKIVSTIILCQYMMIFPNKALLLSIGKNTLYIYLFHYFVVSLIATSYINEWVINNSNFVIDFLLCIIPTTICIVTSQYVANLLTKSEFLKKFIFYKQD